MVGAPVDLDDEQGVLPCPVREPGPRNHRRDGVLAGRGGQDGSVEQLVHRPLEGAPRRGPGGGTLVEQFPQHGDASAPPVVHLAVRPGDRPVADQPSGDGDLVEQPVHPGSPELRGDVDDGPGQGRGRDPLHLAEVLDVLVDQAVHPDAGVVGPTAGWDRHHDPVPRDAVHPVEVEARFVAGPGIVAHRQDGGPDLAGGRGGRGGEPVHAAVHGHDQAVVLGSLHGPTRDAQVLGLVDRHDSVVHGGDPCQVGEVVPSHAVDRTTGPARVATGTATR